MKGDGEGKFYFSYRKRRGGTPRNGWAGRAGRRKTRLSAGDYLQGGMGPAPLPESLKIREIRSEGGKKIRAGRG